MVAALRRQWPILTVLSMIVVALVFVAADRFRVGSVLLALAVVYAVALRAALPDDVVGLLAVRSRRVDLIVLGVMAASLMILALWVPPPQ